MAKLQGMKPEAAEDDDDEGGFFEQDDPVMGDESKAVRPWLGAIKAPSSGMGSDGKPQGLNKAPAIDMKLEWCYGYQSRKTKNNIWYSESSG
jgi:hypothetical protein